MATIQQVHEVWAEDRGEVPEKKDQVPCEVYSRVVGYLRPTSSWSENKRHEFAARQTYDVAGDMKL